MRPWKARWLLLLAALCATCRGGGIQAGDKVRVSDGPTPIKVGTEVLARVEEGTVLEAQGVKGQWVWVVLSREGRTIKGWVHAKRLAPLERGAATDEEAIQPGDRIRVVRGPAPIKVRRKTLATAEAGTELTVEQVHGDWAKVTFRSRGEPVTGWIHAYRVETVAEEPAEAVAPGLAQPDEPEEPGQPNPRVTRRPADETEDFPYGPREFRFPYPAGIRVQHRAGEEFRKAGTAPGWVTIPRCHSWRLVTTLVDGEEHPTTEELARALARARPPGLVLTGSDPSDRTLAAIEGLDQLRFLNLRYSYRITDAGLKHLRGLRQLEHLDLAHCLKITDDALAHLEGLVQLHQLDLDHCIQITDAGLKHLAALRELRMLRLGLCDQITDAGLRHLSRLAQLRELDLRECHRITDDGLGQLRGLARLEALDLAQCRGITDRGLAHLKSLSQLRELSLNHCDKITNAGLAYLSALPLLRELDLSDCDGVTDAALAHLRGLKELRRLDLRECDKITAQGVKELKKALPRCHVRAPTGNQRAASEAGANGGGVAEQEQTTRPGPQQGKAADDVSILVDASRDGGGWWFPQSPKTGFDPSKKHQGSKLVAYLRERGWSVEELPRAKDARISDGTLKGQDLVIRAGEWPSPPPGEPYEAQEVRAYRKYVPSGGRLLLLSDFNRGRCYDQLADAFGIRMEGSYGRGLGTVDRIEAHPLTKGVDSITYYAGSSVVRHPPSARILAYWSEEDGGGAAFGYMPYGEGMVLFMTDGNAIQHVPQPLTDNIFDWLLGDPAHE